MSKNSFCFSAHNTFVLYIVWLFFFLCFGPYLSDEFQLYWKNVIRWCHPGGIISPVIWKFRNCGIFWKSWKAWVRHNSIMIPVETSIVRLQCLLNRLAPLFIWKHSEFCLLTQSLLMQRDEITVLWFPCLMQFRLIFRLLWLCLRNATPVIFSGHKTVAHANANISYTASNHELLLC